MDISQRLLLLVILTAAIGRCRVTRADSSPIDFDRDVATILAGRCFDCHNPAEHKGGLDLTRKTTAMAGGDDGVVIVPGKLAQSPLWKNVSDNEMPPKHPLPEAEKQTLKAWIESGAVWGTEVIDPFRFTTAKRAGYNWWSLQPITEPTKPQVQQSTGERNAIDAFILAGLEREGLTPSPQADRRTLIRRLTFDLTGLPPTPEEVHAFVKDETPEAYEKLVDRLLASPDYGVRWARHWLDIVRFGESHGFERDQLRPNAWRYRDWVVQAFNADLPYDQFVRMQLAGDLLKPSTAEGVIATGFLTAGAFDQVGNDQQSAAMRVVVRQDELEDLVGTVSQTFLSLTANCARCHDHKFDPISQKEYYQLTSALGGVKHGEREIPRAESVDADQAWTKAVDTRLAKVQAELEAIELPARAKLLAAQRNAPPEKLPKPIETWEFDKEISPDKVTLVSASLEVGGLRLYGKGFAHSRPLQQDLGEKTLEAWVSLRDLTQRGGGVIGVQTLDGSVFDTVTFGEREPAKWMAGSENYKRTTSFEGPSESAGANEFVHVAVTYSTDGTIAAYRNGLPYGTAYKAKGLTTFAAGKAQFVFGLRHAPAAPGKLLAGLIKRARVYDKALSAEQIAISIGVPPGVEESRLVEAIEPAKRKLRERLVYEIKAIHRQQSRFAATRTYTNTPTTQPAIAKVLLRGNPAKEADSVSPAGIVSVIGPSANWNLRPDASDADRRLKLAEWITSPANPLFARAIVNRLWLYHFGAGIVDTPNDFGFNGGKPSHPELLDFLARELVVGNWSLKRVHKLMLMSSAYQQSSLPRPDVMAKDASNRLVWRMNPRRIEAEALRDAVLAVSGQLNPLQGGPGYEDYFTFTNNSTFYESRDYVGDTFNRRSLYRTWVRSGRSPLLDVFDCPDPSTKTPRRAVTTTPLQALALMNDSFMLRMADSLADRARREAGEESAKQIARVYELTFTRKPTAAEADEAQTFVTTHGLSAFCRVIMNSSEFVLAD